MNLQNVRAVEALQWINRRGAALAMLALLIGAGIGSHRMAQDRLQVIDTPSPSMTPAAVSRLHFIRYIDTHPWIALPYLAVCAGSLLWLQVRKSPRWSLWVTFALLALPVIGYMRICFRFSLC